MTTAERFIPEVWEKAIADQIIRPWLQSPLWADDRDEYEKSRDRERYRSERAEGERAKAELWDRLQNLNHGIMFGALMGPILDLHQPTFDYYPTGRCEDCIAVYSWGGEAADWPCATITTLARAVDLGHIVDRIKW